jgi:hypothetical protein
MKDLGGKSNNENMIFVDCPGYGDTMGAEIDIANGLGIMNAVRKAREVIPILFISSKNIGDKAEGIRNLV